MFVGYGLSHALSVYKMFNFKMNKVIISRDIKWLDLTYCEWKIKTNNDNETYHYNIFTLLENDDDY